MKKRIMMIMLTIMMLSSCYYADQVFGDIKDEYRTSKTREKNGGGAIDNEKYESGVKEAIRDVAKRPLNKKEQIDGLTLILPENTSINTKMGNVIDLKTGYGLPIIISNNRACVEKKIRDNLYYGINYDKYVSGIKEIVQNIIKVNGFKNTCN